MARVGVGDDDRFSLRIWRMPNARSFGCFVCVNCRRTSPCREERPPGTKEGHLDEREIEGNDATRVLRSQNPAASRNLESPR